MQIHAIVLFNDFCKDIEQERTQKFLEVHCQYSLYTTVKEFIEDLTSYVRKYVEEKFRYSKIAKNHLMKVWLLREDLEKNIFFNMLRQGCKANNTFEYKLYIEGELLEGNTQLNEYDITIQSQFVF